MRHRAPAYQRRAPLRRISSRGHHPPGIPVLPPINGGLHCGPDTGTRRAAWNVVLPPINGGLHCGRVETPAFTPGSWVLPPINGGLHCGLAGRYGPDFQLIRAPAYQRRAPLRPREPDASPPARPGAPAYQRRAPLRPHLHPPMAIHAAGCSRLSTAGSIAARHRAAAAAGPRSRAPAYQRRAPLRLILDADTNPDIGAVLPPINGGLHCGVDAFNRYRKTLTVLPPINGGLHCGTTVGEVAACTEGGAPAYQRRAPLRHG